MQFVKIGLLWPIGSNIRNGKKIKTTYRDRGINDFFDSIQSKKHLKLSKYFTILKFDKKRSVYERALDVDHRNIPLWLKYTEMEMRNKQV